MDGNSPHHGTGIREVFFPVNKIANYFPVDRRVTGMAQFECQVNGAIKRRFQDANTLIAEKNIIDELVLTSFLVEKQDLDTITTCNITIRVPSNFQPSTPPREDPQLGQALDPCSGFQLA